MNSLNIGSPAPDFSLPDLEGQLVQLAQLRGTPVLLNFFKSTCPWCQVEMPRLAEVYRRQADVEVRVLGIVVGQDDASAAAKFAQQKKLDFPMLVDSDRSVRAAYSLQRVPTLILVDAEGQIARIYEGSSEQLAGIVEQTILAAAGGDQLPEYYLVGNG